MRINGNAWQDLTPEQIADSEQNYANAFSQDDSFLKFIIFGKRAVRRLLSVDGAKGLKIKMGLLENEDSGKQQLFPILVAVDKFGNELPAPDEVEFDEDNDDEGEVIARGDDGNLPVKCPTSCS